jgi:hypothetical protein
VESEQRVSDMNAIDRSEHEYHKAAELGLNDVWEDVFAPPRRF